MVRAIALVLLIRALWIAPLTAAAWTVSPSTVANAGEVYTTVTKSVRVNNSQVDVDVGATTRKHDFGPTGGFVDPESGVPNLATIVVSGPSGKNTVISGPRVTNAGVAGRAEWTPAGALMASRSGEGFPGEPCRAQASSYQLSPDVPLVWNLTVQLGDAGGAGWPLLASGTDPVLLWQVKAPGLRPSLAMVADTDETNLSRVMLIFSALTGASKNVQRAGTVRGLVPGTPIDVRIAATLDEREPSVGGSGRWRAWVNGNLVFDRPGPTLKDRAEEAHQWFFGIYRYLTHCPSNVTRITRWHKLLLETGS